MLFFDEMLPHDLNHGAHRLFGCWCASIVVIEDDRRVSDPLMCLEVVLRPSASVIRGQCRVEDLFFASGVVGTLRLI